MVLYADETVQIKVVAKDFNKSILDDGDIADVFITIFDSEAEEVLASSAMTYDAEEAGWVYSWDTMDVDPGLYKARIEALGNTPPDQPYSLEYKRIRLRSRPIGL